MNETSAHIAQAVAVDAFVITISSEHIATFAKAIGEHDPVFYSREEARTRGFQNIPIPPTYPFYLEAIGIPHFDSLCEAHGIEPLWLVHAEQEYKYYGDVFADDVITCTPTILFDWIRETEQRCVVEIDYHNQAGVRLISSRSTFLMNQNLRGSVEGRA